MPQTPLQQRFLGHHGAAFVEISKESEPVATGEPASGTTTGPSTAHHSAFFLKSILSSLTGQAHASADPEHQKQLLDSQGLPFKVEKTYPDAVTAPSGGPGRQPSAPVAHDQSAQHDPGAENQPPASPATETKPPSSRPSSSSRPASLFDAFKSKPHTSRAPATAPAPLPVVSGGSSSSSADAIVAPPKKTAFDDSESYPDIVQLFSANIYDPDEDQRAAESGGDVGGDDQQNEYMHPGLAALRRAAQHQGITDNLLLPPSGADDGIAGGTGRGAGGGSTAGETGATGTSETPYWSPPMLEGGSVEFQVSDRQDGVEVERVEIDFGPYVLGKQIRVLGQLDIDDPLEYK